MTFHSRFLVLSVMFVFAAAAGCATVPDVNPEGPPGLPEGHPEMGKTHPWHPDPRVDAYTAFIRGMLFADEGQYDQAMGYLEMAARMDTGSTAPLVELMRVQLETGKREEAERTGRKALEIDPDLAIVHIALGQLFLESGRVVEALSHLLTGTELGPENTNALFPLAEAMERSGDREGAKNVLEKLSVTEGHEALASLLIARLHLRSDDIPGAIDPLIRAVQLNPSFLSALEDLGQQMEKGGRTREAILMYEGFLAKEPGNTPVRGFLAKALLLNGRQAEARTHLETILEEDPEDRNALLLMGLIESREENFEKALEIFNRLRRISGDSFETLMQIGTLQREMKMEAEATATFEEAARAHPDRFEPHLNLAVIHDAAREMEQAEASARTALSLAPDRSNIRSYLAQLLTGEERYEEAIALLQEGLAKNPDDTTLLFQLGITYDHSGRFDLTEKALERLITADPNHPDALNYLGYSWAERGLKLQEAFSMIRRALEISPDAAYIIDSLGWVYYQMGNYEEALKHLLIAVEKMSKDPTVLDHLGDTYEKLGQDELAVLYWSKALAADPDNTDIARKIREKGAAGTVP